MLFIFVVGKDAWPELVGEQGKKAAQIIEKENSYVQAFVIKEGTMVTMDFRCDRVRVWVDCDGIVVQTPIIG